MGLMIKLGSFVCDKDDTKHEYPAVVIYDHAIHGHTTSVSIKWMEDGHMSLRKPEQLKELTPLEFCKSWCGKHMGYDGYDNQEKM